MVDCELLTAGPAWVRRLGMWLLLALPCGCSGAMLDPVGGKNAGGESGSNGASRQYDDGSNREAGDAGSDGGPGGCARGVTFADARLETAVRAALQIPSGPISADRAANLTLLDVSDKGVASLNGVQCLVNLSTVYGFRNSIADLTPLAELSGLTTLLIGNNQVADLTPLAGLTTLTYLDVADNQIADIAPLAGLTRLTDLDLGTNHITDITPLAGLTSLTGLLLEHNQITDVAPLAGLTNLQHLYLNDNPIMDLAPVVACMCPAKPSNSLALDRVPGVSGCGPDVAALKACGVNSSFGGC